MYDTFGNFDSHEEINACAAGLLAEGDTKNLKDLSVENGIPEVLVDIYINGGSDEMVGWMDAAIGKLEVEAKEYKNNQIPVEPVADYLKSLCMEESFARAVRHRTKSIKGCIERIEKKCKKIQKETGRHYVADLTVFHWARDYLVVSSELWKN